MASLVYNEGAYQLRNGGSINWGSDTIKVMLIATDTPYVPDKDETVLTTAAASELSVSGYVAGFAGGGRATLGSKTLTKDTANDRIVYDAADPAAWTLAAGKTVAAAVLYKHDTNDATSIPLFYLDFTDFPTNGGTFTLVFASTGIAYTQQ